jgi:hypothetical protein
MPDATAAADPSHPVDIRIAGTPPTGLGTLAVGVVAIAAALLRALQRDPPGEVGVGRGVVLGVELGEEPPGAKLRSRMWLLLARN